jgi:hypothetical protein
MSGLPSYTDMYRIGTLEAFRLAEISREEPVS